MPSPIRLLAVPEDDQRTVRFYAAFPAPALDAPPDCRPAGLFTGDPKTGQEGGKIAELTLCAPTAVTWHEDNRVELGSYTYASPGRQAAHLRWGEAIVVADIDLGSETGALAEPQPTLALFVVKPAADQPLEAAIRLEVLGLHADQQLRIDAGAGQIYLLPGSDGPDQQAEWLVSYHKSGEYTVAVDLLDGEGYWLATLAQNSLEIAPPAEPALPEQEGEPEQPAAPAPPLLEAGELPGSNPPWLPFNYVRPVWGGVRTYTTPGGNRVSRSLVLGTYLAIQSETVVGGQVWYRSTHGDWVAASAVAQVTPSSLRGVELQAATPPTPPPPPPGGVRYGVVTAALLNVRARPGVSPDNPPIAQLPSGAQVTIYEERLVDGATWYRIGDSRWVHGAYVRLIQEPPPPSLRRGVVTADVLNVRSQPGVGYPVVDQLRLGAEVTIYEEQPVASVPWYRIGAGRWVHSGWVRVLPAELAAQEAVASGPTLPVGWVVSASLNVRARPGVSPDNPPIDEVLHNQRLDILETRTVDGARWYRIGADRWVLGTWVAAALPKPRPAGIRANERWVGVNLGQQTAVAYRGDTPVYAAMVATGLPTTPTVQGVFRTWQRLTTGKMSGGSAATGGYYYLEGVTWTCYFYSGYALHTAYWHDAFGRPRSHGCVNLSPYDAWWIFQWSAPGGASSPAVYVYAG
jgi:uncharacterized protein YgiM (DUF1202 family)